ncbi:TLD domain-containing protein 1 [Rhizophagus clarus]|uniref:MTOR-associated protein MEAK7 n=1 Tax=Rhizophagus clarus TaxID=94130 RepID=A0A8H3ME95_9GLOM|nr:TLD domain-containing protein 1 [Rhizophagus clarus]
MGNHTSKTSKALLHDILSQFSEEEKAVLLKEFEEFASDNDLQNERKHEKHGTGVTALSIKKQLPTVLGDYLKDGFMQYFQIQSTSTENYLSAEKIEKLTLQPSPSLLITQLGFVSSIRNLSKTIPSDQSRAAFIGAYISQTGQTKYRGKKGERDIFLNSDNTGIVDYLILFPNLKHGELEEESLFNLIKEADIGGHFNEGSFMDWYMKNTHFQHLFNISIIRIFLRRDLPQNLTDIIRTLKSANLIAPEIFSTYKALPNFSQLLAPSDYYILNSHLPPDCRVTTHKLLFSSTRDGDSWSTFINCILYQGSTLIVIKDKDGHIFGGFAYEDWELKPNWYGNEKNFLFSIKPKLRVFTSTGYNDHYQYLNYGTKTLPNGLGMGGQFDFCGLWINSDIINGNSMATPLSSTYSSSQLSKKQEFKVDEIEVWLVKLTEKDPDEIAKRPKCSALDRNPAELELLEMATNKKMYSKEVREPNLFIDEKE